MNDELPAWMSEVLSEARLRAYVDFMRGDGPGAVRLYRWNVEASAALFGPFHWLEVALRNSVHNRLSEHHARPDWWAVAPLDGGGVRKVAEARRNCLGRGKAGTPDDIVAELSFGFWGKLLTRSNDRGFWVPVVHKAFPGYQGSRRVLADQVLSLVLLRNRIMHHEPIHHRDLREDHAKLYRVMGYVNQDLAKDVRAMDRFPAILADKPRALRDDRQPRF
ncbi:MULTISPECIES: hypothetical protein [Streptomyces]|uniref:Abi-like protein n=1 Tax=Streptomyces venezuelae TaxID=54571 RepID=A0A5P2ART0_STRVZ|nr:hypothetical protein [Streptomyces venezuelae]QES20825.1 hypothetical protein DEJ46_18250 [Streptomyces venezuelae]